MWAVYVRECGRMCVDVGGIYGWMWVDVILSVFLASFLSLPLLFDTRRLRVAFGLSEARLQADAVE